MLGTSLRHGSLTEVRDQGLEFLILVGSTRHQASKAPWEAPTHFLRSEKCRKVSAQRRFSTGFSLTDFKQMGFPNPQRPAASINTDEVKDEKDSLSAQASPSKNHLKLQFFLRRVHDLSFFPSQIRNSPGNAIHCSFFSHRNYVSKTSGCLQFIYAWKSQFSIWGLPASEGKILQSLRSR